MGVLLEMEDVPAHGRWEAEDEVDGRGRGHMHWLT